MSVLWPYKMTSEGCASLARLLGVKRVHADKKFKPAQDSLVINWGNSEMPQWKTQNVPVFINHPNRVAVAIDKLRCLMTLRAAGVSTVPFTEDKETAQEWADDGHPVFCRTKLRGSGGDGIEVAFELDEVIDAKLYTKGLVKKHDEFRIHVLNGAMFHVAMKRRVAKERREALGIDVNAHIRNHANGWIFATDNVLGQLRTSTVDTATQAVRALGLDFGAVDILQSQRVDAAHVLEVNTAPGLAGRTLTVYGNVFNNLINQYRTPGAM